MGRPMVCSHTFYWTDRRCCQLEATIALAAYPLLPRAPVTGSRMARIASPTQQVLLFGFAGSRTRGVAAVSSPPQTLPGLGHSAGPAMTAAAAQKGSGLVQGWPLGYPGREKASDETART